MVWVAIEIAACLTLLLLKNKTGFLCYQICIAGIYLLTLTFVHTLDETMAVYFFFAVFPFLQYLICPTKLCVFSALYIIFWILVSIINNGFLSVVSVLIVRYLGPLSFLYLYGRMPDHALLGSLGDQNHNERYVKIAVLVAIIFELAITVAALTQSSDGRLMLNFQCVAGCLACVCMLLLVYLVRNGDNVIFSLGSAFIMAFLAINSGTRGYMVLAIVLSIAVIFTCFKGGKAVLLLLAFVSAIVAFIAFSSSSFSDISFIERFSESTGRRGAENEWAFNMLALQGPFRDLFGFGLGSNYLSQPDAIDAIRGISVDLYTRNVIIEGSGIHNFWLTCTLSLGLLGIALYIAPFVQHCFRSLQKCDRFTLIIQIVFICTYAFVLWFRWTATGGFLEACVLAYFIAASNTRKFPVSKSLNHRSTANRAAFRQ